MSIDYLTTKLRQSFSEDQSAILAEVIVETVEQAQQQLVKAKDFNELKEIVRSVAEEQKKLTEEQKKLTEEQKKLTKAQNKTEITMQELAYAMKNTHKELAGLAKSVGYSLENEAFRALPLFLKEHYGIELSEKFIRADMEGEEINILAKGKKDGKDVMVVGEATLRLDKSNRDKFAQLESKISLVSKNYPGLTIIPLLVTHYTTKNILQMAKEKGIIIVQSFEWA